MSHTYPLSWNSIFCFTCAWLGWKIAAALLIYSLYKSFPAGIILASEWKANRPQSLGLIHKPLWVIWYPEFKEFIVQHEHAVCRLPAASNKPNFNKKGPPGWTRPSDPFQPAWFLGFQLPIMPCRAGSAPCFYDRSYRIQIQVSFRSLIEQGPR